MTYYFFLLVYGSCTQKLMFSLLHVVKLKFAELAMDSASTVFRWNLSVTFCECTNVDT